MESIKDNVKKLLEELSSGNVYGEKVTLVAATKTQSVDKINEAIASGIADIGENKVQEFKEKYDGVIGGNRHFIGHLQTNKIKYLIGKTYLYQSIDRFELAKELNAKSERANLISDILIQVNIGNEESKSGFEYGQAYDAYLKIKEMKNLRILGFMAMLPAEGEREFLASLVRDMRSLYDRAKAEDENIKFLSMGMSGDYKLCIENGSNMVRIGSTIFGHRNYN